MWFCAGVGAPVMQSLIWTVDSVDVWEADCLARGHRPVLMSSLEALESVSWLRLHLPLTFLSWDLLNIHIL